MSEKALVPIQRGVRRTPSAPAPSLFDGHVFHEPASHPQLRADEVCPRPDVEVLTDEEKKQQEQLRDVPPPTAIFDRQTRSPESLVGHLGVNTEALLGFLSALSIIAPDGPDLVRAVKMSYMSTEHGPRLGLEAASPTTQAYVLMKTDGESVSGFSVLLPLQRSINVLRALRGEYSTILIGLDNEMVHLGPLSISPAGSVSDFPERRPIYNVEARAVMPAYYLEEIVTRLLPVLVESIDSLNPRGLHIDFAEGVAVAGDGELFHLLQLPRMGVESRIARVALPSVTIRPEFFRFLVPVVNRDWAAFQINADQISAAGDDFAVVTRCVIENYMSWKSAIRKYAGSWVLDKAAFLAALQETRALGGRQVRLQFDAGTEGLKLTWSIDRECYKKVIVAKRYEAPPVAMVDAYADELARAVEACRGGLIRLGLDPDKTAKSPVTVRGEDDEFLAIVPGR